MCRILKTLLLTFGFFFFMPSSIYAGSLIGTITDPFAGGVLAGGASRATSLLAAIIRLITIAAGLYALVNFAIAGIGFISSGGNPESIQHSWARIYQTLIGICVVILSFAIAGLLGILLFGNPSAILRPSFFGP